MTPAELWTLGGIIALFSAGSAWGGARSALNGTRKNVEEIAKDVKDLRERMVRVETTLDIET